MKRILVMVLLLSLLAPLTMRESSTLAQTTGGACADSEEASFLHLINSYRAENGLGALALSQTLNLAADALSVDMAANNFFSHTGSDGSSFVDRLSSAGYPEPTFGGEITFAGRASAVDAFAGYKNSPAHNAAMLDPNYQAIGIARANNPDSDWQWYWTGTFGPTVDGAGCYGEATTVVQAASAEDEIAVSEELIATATVSDPAISPTIEPTVPVEPTPLAAEPTVPVEPTTMPVEPTVPVEPTAVPVEPTEPVEPTPIAEEPSEPIEPTPISEEPIELAEPTEAAL